MRFVSAVTLGLIIAACSNEAPPPAAPPPPPVAPPPAPPPTVAPAPVVTADATFAALADAFLKEYLRREPVAATAQGEHAYDAAWPDMSAAGDTDYLAFLAKTRASLDAIAVDQLSAGNKVDAAILRNQLDYQAFKLRELKPAETAPLTWTTLIGDGFDPLLTREFASKDERMKSVSGRMKGVPGLVAIAKQRLGHPAKVNTETAIKQTAGLIELCKKDVGTPEANDAAKALEDFRTFLQKEVLPRSDGSFRVGAERFKKILGYELEDNVDPEKLVQDARNLMAKTQSEMAMTVLKLWPTLFPKVPFPKTDSEALQHAVIAKVLAEVAKDHPTNATIVNEARTLLGDATKFVRDNDLVGVPTEECKVVEMPEYRRGVSIAYCDSTGPLEKKQESVYTISPTPKDWPVARADSFYREYNRSMLHDLTVHEAMPGHFLQAMHANQTKDDLRAVFSSGAFVEGWAVYSEWMMSQHGFGGDKVRLQRQKMALRVAANTVLDHDVHAGTMEEKDALKFMREQAFQEEGEAVAKWNRARLSAGQLSTYYYGFAGMMAMRTEAEAKPDFKERTYHDKLLSFGSPAIRHAQALVR